MIFSVERVKVRCMFWLQCRTVLPTGWYASESYMSFLKILRTQSKDWNLVALGSREPFGEGKKRGQGNQFSVAQVRSGPREGSEGRDRREPKPHS